MGAFQSDAFQENFQQDALVATFIGPNISDFALAKSALVSRNYAGRFDGPGLSFSSTGTLPPGLSITSAGILTGTPTTVGTYAGIRIVATDSGLNTAQSNAFTITIISGQRGDIGGGNIGGADIGGPDIGGPDIDTPLWWVS